MTPLRLVLIGRKLTEDLLFWEQLGRAVKASPETPMVLLHGPGEVTERTLEGDGLSVADAGRDPETDAAIIAAFRAENRRSVAMLTDAGLPAVGFLGTDRRMISMDQGLLNVRADLISRTAASGTIPLLGGLFEDRGLVRIAGLGGMASAWGRADGAVSIRWLVPRPPRELMSG
ncbi:MAG: hypothetical protein HKN29_05905, partial [Rhodothermales bacterium]|nr:hypothetical protein [Rhodothermales bacterium]